MAITLFVDNVEYDGFEDVRVFRSIETIASEFEFQATIQDPADFPIKLGSECEVFVNGIRVVQGYIEDLECETGATSHSIFISGRDKTCDVVDSSIFANIDIPNSISLVDLIKLVLEKSNITGIDVIDNIGDIDIFTTNDKVSAEIGENVFEFIEKYCRKRQVMCTTDGDGNISLERASKQEIARYLVNQLDGVNNNIKSIRFGLNNTNRFSKVIIKSQGNPILQQLGLQGDNLVDVNAFAVDEDIRTSRTKVVMNSTSLTPDKAQPMADWFVNIERARGVTASLVVQGFSYDENNLLKIWRPNRLINIKDDFWDIKAKMLIKSVEYTFNNNEGSVTNLELTNRDAYTLAAQEQEIFKKNEDKGSALLAALGL